MSTSIREAFYLKHEDELTKEKANITRRKNTIGWTRVGVFALGLWGVITVWPETGSALLIGIAAIAIFLALLNYSLRLQDQVNMLSALIRIHQEEREIGHHRFSNRYNGDNLAPRQHEYSADLDIFGRASLFQYIHRTTSEQGHRHFASWLLSPAPNAAIKARQKAALELSNEPGWGIHYQAIGQQEPVSRSIEEKLGLWLSKSPVFLPKTGWKLLAAIFPFISLACLVLHLAGLMSAPLFYLLVLVFVVIAFSITKMVIPQYQALDKIVPQLNTLSGKLRWIETSSFSADQLVALKQQLHPAGKPAASASITGLRKILDRFDYRLNPLVFLPLNTFLLWDLRQVLSLEKWKSVHSTDIGKWFETMAEMEALNSIGRLAFNHPGWTFPVLTEEQGDYSGASIGHPLIPESTRVNNDFSTSGKPAIALITGSNMAGKSTFLRSIGVNQVLAMCGAPVCASSLTVSNMRIMSSMRIADNLEENASTFYAELSKLKSIIESVNRFEPVFLLLDEILRGTNSHDRHTGSRALVMQLIRHNACGMLATHDLALTSLVEDYPKAIRNYHFDVSVSGEELYFDYRLKEGVCQSMNASILMKKIGIEL
jgi:hypothetical protein